MAWDMFSHLAYEIVLILYGKRLRKNEMNSILKKTETRSTDIDCYPEVCMINCKTESTTGPFCFNSVPKS